MSLKLIENDKTELLNHRLTLYSGQTMPLSTFHQKVRTNTLYEIVIEPAPASLTEKHNNRNNLIIGYTQLCPMMHLGQQYTGIEELEIFEEYRSLKYGSIVVTLIKSIYPSIFVIDIQPTAIGFWYRTMGDAYWRNLFSLFPSIDSLNATLKYSGETATFFHNLYYSLPAK